MNTLIVYDKEGVIIQQITGSYRIPVGIPYIEVEVPSNKTVSHVENNEPIFVDSPPSEFDKLRLELAESQAELLGLILGGM